MLRVSIAFVVIAMLSACSQAPGPTPAQQADQEQRLEEASVRMVGILQAAGRCLSQEEMQQEVLKFTSSRQEALIVTLFGARRASDRGDITITQGEPNYFGLPEFGACP